MDPILVFKSIACGIILLLPIYYVLRKIAAVLIKKPYVSAVDTTIDKWVLKVLKAITRKDEEVLREKSSFVVSFCRYLILFVPYYLFISVIPQILR